MPRFRAVRVSKIKCPTVELQGLFDVVPEITESGLYLPHADLYFALLFKLYVADDLARNFLDLALHFVNAALDLVLVHNDLLVIASTLI